MPLRADLRFKVKETYTGATSTTTEYHKGNRWRRDSEDHGGCFIVDPSNKRTITIDPSKQEYLINTLSRPEPATDPSQTIVVEIETRDTGERKQMFGHSARHLITTERRHTELLQKPRSETRETTTDGWYLDLPLPVPHRSQVGAVAVLTTLDRAGRSRGIPKVQVTRHGPVPQGLAVWESTGGNQLEVTEFSEGPLDDALFEPPVGFRRVIRPLPGERLSWADQLLFGLQEFQDWLARL
jgi:hypothetical protein